MTILFKGRVVFKQCIPKEYKHFSKKLFKLYDFTGYTGNMDVYFGKDQQCVTQDVTATHATVIDLTRRVEGQSHKLYMGNFLSSLDLFHILTKKKINCCGAVRPNRKGVPQDIGWQDLSLKRGDIRVRPSGDFTALVWKGKVDVHMFTNVNNPPTEGNCCNENGNIQKPIITGDYNRHNMGYVNKEDNGK
jgi:hypothetical protein